MKSIFTLKTAIIYGFALACFAALFVIWTMPYSETQDQLRAKYVAVLDGQKKEQLALADVASASGAEFNEQGARNLETAERLKAEAAELFSDADKAFAWAQSCRDANKLGTFDEAVDCSVIPVPETLSGSTQTGSAITETGSLLEAVGLDDAPELKIEKPSDELISEVDRSDSHLAEIARRLVWKYNANGYAQSPVGLTGSGVEHRAIQVLRAYKFDERFGLTKDYGWTLFKKVGDRYGIKPEVLVCIAKADSSLGRWLKTENNIGNVGNNDRGNVVSFGSVGAGIDHIGLTLTNKWLGYKQSIGSLSPVGGGDSPYYATSKGGEWYFNVRNCVAEIHDDVTVGPDFLFRK